MRKFINDECGAAPGKHEQLVENLQEKYGISADGKLCDEFFGDKIAQSIEALPGTLRSVVVLSDIEQLRYSEIAETLACPVGTVCSRLHRGRKVLQHSLQNFSSDDNSVERKIKNLEWLKKNISK